MIFKTNLIHLATTTFFSHFLEAIYIYILYVTFFCRDNARMEILGNVVVQSHLWRWRHISLAAACWNNEFYDNDA